MMAIKVEAVAYDNPIPGYGTRNTINLRLWPAKPSEGHDIESYNTGDYINAIVNRQKEIIISNVLYPDERSYQQKYFFVSASLQIIYDINFAFIEELKKKIGQDYVRMSRMSIVEEGAVKDALPPEEMNPAEVHCEKADVVLCLGTRSLPHAICLSSAFVVAKRLL
ncbi:hypothetical protein L2E82_05135 [Cichorium intybus]|uniref:Uncharacterized protein n=1 Tax=Cichorium intybus TaxID=13427 RepID=A0ACB9H8T9_CICIN|nr:hypothetical protein L2E82_05135 [Cichorium intybus]